MAEGANVPRVKVRERERPKEAPRYAPGRLEAELAEARAEIEAGKKALEEADKMAVNLKRDIDSLEAKLAARDRDLAEKDREQQLLAQTLKAAQSEARNLQVVNTIIVVLAVAAVLMIGLFALLG